MRKVAITGATGFIGRHICASFEQLGIDYVRLTRQPECGRDRFYDLSLKKLSPTLFEGVDTLIHAAAYVHKDSDKLMHQKLNFEATKLLFDSAISKKLNIIFISTVGVYGQVASKDIIDERDELKPLNVYSQAKLNCEEYLEFKAKSELIMYTTFRLPLVIGMSAPGTFGLLEKMMLYGLPLPFKKSDNLRSVLDVECFAEFMAGFYQKNIFLNKSVIVKNKEDMSLDAMLVYLSGKNNKPYKSFYFPTILIKILLYILFRKKIAQQLFGSLVFRGTFEV